jgi:hypothetical protein
MGHPRPQLPQFAASVLASTQVLPHKVLLSAQVVAHTPSAQTSPVAQRCPHCAQLLASAPSATHTPPHRACPSGQAQTPY